MIHFVPWSWGTPASRGRRGSPARARVNVGGAEFGHQERDGCHTDESARGWVAKEQRHRRRHDRESAGTPAALL
jgi:hypothetical protein